jgi:hypothetical protein
MGDKEDEAAVHKLNEMCEVSHGSGKREESDPRRLPKL